jgi:hypothetical protein
MIATEKIIEIRLKIAKEMLETETIESQRTFLKGQIWALSSLIEAINQYSDEPFIEKVVK